MKEKSAIDELKKLEEFVETRNEWFTKEEKKKRGGKRTPKVQTEEGSSSQPQKKRKKKAVETLLVDEPEEDETEADVEKDQEQLSPETEQLLKSIDDTLEAGKSASQKVVGDEEKSLSGSDDDVDAEVDQWIKENLDPRDREIPKKRKRSTDDDDEMYVPPENVQVVSPPSSTGGRKKSTSRKRVKSQAESQSKPPSPPPQNKPPSPPPPQESEPLQSQQSPPQHHTLSPIHEQPQITSPLIQQTPPIPQQPQVHSTPESSGFTNFPPIPENISLEQLDDFSFVNDDLVKKLQKKVDEVSSEKKKLEKRVKTVKAENSSLLKKVEADQVDIDILKVRIAVLEEEKARRDEQNEYFKLKNKELEAQNAKKEHDEYMLKKVIEDLIDKSIEQRFEEIELEEVRAKRKAEIEAEMKNKGKDVQVESVVQVTEREIVPSIVSESFIQDPCPITSIPGDEDDDEDNGDDDDNLKDDADEVYSVHGNDDDDQGTSGIKVTETSNEKNVDDYLHDDANEESENAKGEGEQGNAEKDDETVDKSTRLILRLEHDVEEGEILHTYTHVEIVKMTHVEDNEFKFDFEEELKSHSFEEDFEEEFKFDKVNTLFKF
ncbi:hypothetical protein HanRHA438_Chr12g0542781 [Helianthus annuus]|nr:hypothetical protein HanOQP8_Chr12g0438591 [Helianthus annuus]KAJ0865646.1 hypothetical protein HanRHA438_Chr12g0542781 [Helianthus annuus]